MNEYDEALLIAVTAAFDRSQLFHYNRSVMHKRFRDDIRPSLLDRLELAPVIALHQPLCLLHVLRIGRLDDKDSLPDNLPDLLRLDRNPFYSCILLQQVLQGSWLLKAQAVIEYMPCMVIGIYIYIADRYER